MSRPAFDYTLDFKNIDFRRHPELYRIGKGFTSFADPDGLPLELYWGERRSPGQE